MPQTQMTVTVTTTDTMVLKNFFFPTDKASVVAAQLKALTGEEKAALASGIRDGSFAY